MSQTAVRFAIAPVTTPEQMEQFLDVPARVYANDPNWVPPLRSSVAKKFAPDNPFFQYGRLQAFVALDSDSQPAGRIVAAVNDRLVEAEGKPVGLFGFFECIDDFEIANSLLEAACDWLRDRGTIEVRGPIDLSTHNDCLFLVEGFDSPPMVMMPYNPPYYPQFMERAGWEKAKDAYAYDFPLDKPLPPEFEKAHRIACKSGVTFRPIRTKGEGFEQDARSLYRLFTTAFSNNWSSTPRSEAEFLEEAREMQDLVDPDVFPIAEYDGEMVGFFMGFPDYNIPMKHVNGKLNWWGIIKFLWYRRKINRGRVMVICSLPEYRRKMVPLALIYLGIRGSQIKGKPYKRAELSWVWEDNQASRRLIEASGGELFKTYRIYQKSLSRSP